MNRARIDPIADAVLYEGYILYPYRPSTKNRQRWSFGGLYPETYCRMGQGDSWFQQTECLVLGGADTSVEVVVRFLHLTARQVGEIDPSLSSWDGEGLPSARPVESLDVGGRLFQSWQEAEEREVALVATTLDVLCKTPERRAFTFAGGLRSEPIHGANGTTVGVLSRNQEAIEGVVELSAAEVGDGRFRLSLRVLNETPLQEGPIPRDLALLSALVSTHALLGVERGEFVSLIDPPECCREDSSACKNVGAWPVLVGEEGEAEMMLASPIILYDYPKIAPESAGDLFDGTEIDEILTLRIMTLTDDEKIAMTAVDARAGDLLARTEALAREQLVGLHGTFRGLRPIPGGVLMDSWLEETERHKLESVHVGPAELRAGDSVRLRPRRRADIMDIALDGKIATIEAIEQDFEDRVFVAVTVDDDPGKDFGSMRLPGHRFFFLLEEIEPLTGEIP